MRHYLIIAICICTTFTEAQIKHGSIVYERKVDVYRRIQDEQTRAMVPHFQTSKSELLFNDNISIYRAVQEDNAPDPFEHNSGHRVMLKVGGPGENTLLYRNYSNQKFLEQTDLGEKTYLIVDTVKQTQWKLTDDEKQILGHKCKKATTKDKRGSDVVAWYAEDISCPLGPDVFGGLAGLILLLDINNGEIVYSALSINDKLTALINEPVKGKAISRVDFEKKLDELFGPASPDGKRTIRMQN